MKTPIRVAVTGAAGQIGYALLFRIASGEMLGKDQPVILQLLDLPQAQNAVKGVMMELQDCAFPLLAGMIATDDPEVAFKDAQIAILVGARPRSKGMERADLLQANAQIFTVQGAALNKVADRNVKVLVVGNPANTNAYIAMKSAPDLPAKNFTAMLRLDHNRAASQLAEKTGKAVRDIEKLCVWGNHSPTMYADYRFATIGGESVKDLINDQDWNANVFLPTVGKRGAAIIEARGLSSAASAANAAIDHIRDWVLGTNGFNNYKTPEFIWAIDITEDITGSLRSFWGHMDIYTYSYAAVGARKGINKYLQDQIPEYDLRKDWFHPKSGIPWNKFFSATGKPIGTMADRTWLSDIVFMRMAEIYLIASEAAARNGDDASAKTILLKLLKERTAADKYSDVETDITALGHDELLEKIFYNWRVEMWGEGLALTVIKRFKYDNKRSARSLFFKEEAIKWDDPRLVYEIPQNETTNNPLIK